MSKSTIAKILAGVASVALLAQDFIQQQSALPHDVQGWIKLIVPFALYAAVHHASNTSGSH